MVKKRIIPTLLLSDYGLVKGVRFNSWRRTGSALQAIKVYNLREVDEIVLLDIKATEQGRAPDCEFIDELADECFMPMTVGGGIRSVDDIAHLLSVGADKICINTAALQDPDLIENAVCQFGSQCIVVSIDVLRHDDGRYEVFTHSGKQATGIDPVAWAKEIQKRGAGELLLTSIDRDGTFEGYDVELTRSIVDAVDIPVIASGGAGCYEHMEKVLKEGKAAAAAAASIYHFTEQTPREAKNYLLDKGIDVRPSYT